MKSKYCVYIHKNKINNKIYVGITSQIPEQRWRNGTNYYGNKYFTRSIKKYGWENFEHIILFKDITKQEAESKEIELIQLYKSYMREYGYNIELGGSSKGKHSKETREKISKSQKGELNHMYGKRGKLCHQSKQVIRLNDGKIFDSAKDAMTICNVKTQISACCNRKMNYAGKFDNGEYMFWMWYKDYQNLNKKEIENYICCLKNKISINGSKNPNAKRIKCIETEEIFECITVACSKYGIKPSNISACLNGRTTGCFSKIANKHLSFSFVSN